MKAVNDIKENNKKGTQSKEGTKSPARTQKRKDEKDGVIFNEKDFKNVVNVFTLARKSCVEDKDVLAGIMNYENLLLEKMEKANGKNAK